MIPLPKLVNLGDSLLLIPVAAVIATWLACTRARRLALWWCVLFFGGLALVGASKIAFLGWGLGIRAIDMKGFSGHAMRTTAVAPVLLYLVLHSAPLYWRRAAALLGLALGAGMGLLLISCGYHSVSETLAGWLIGAFASLAWVRMAEQSPPLELDRSALSAGLLVFVMAVMVMPVSGTYIMTKIALYLSGNSTPYKWKTWRM